MDLCLGGHTVSWGPWAVMVPEVQYKACDSPTQSWLHVAQEHGCPQASPELCKDSWKDPVVQMVLLGYA